MDQHQLARIQFLSRRFRELQGLRLALAGGTIAAVFGSYLLTSTPSATGGLIALVVSFVLMVPGQWWAHQYYTRTVGRQVQAPVSPWWPVIFVLAYSLMSAYLDRRFPGIPAGGPTVLTVVLASLIVALRDWPWRAHYLLAAAMPTAAFTMATFRGDTIDPGLTLSAALLATGVAMVPVGLLDHRLLLKLMSETADDVRLPARRQAPN